MYKRHKNTRTEDTHDIFYQRHKNTRTDDTNDIFLPKTQKHKNRRHTEHFQTDNVTHTQGKQTYPFTVWHENTRTQEQLTNMTFLHKASRSALGTVKTTKGHRQMARSIDIMTRNFP